MYSAFRFRARPDPTLPDPTRPGPTRPVPLRLSPARGLVGGRGAVGVVVRARGGRGRGRGEPGGAEEADGRHVLLAPHAQQPPPRAAAAGGGVLEREHACVHVHVTACTSRGVCVCAPA
jgi:hypothetical protein